MEPRDELMTLADRYWESVLEASPSVATLLGDRRYDDRIEDVSATAEGRLSSHWEKLLSEVEALDNSALGDDDKVTWQLLQAELSSSIESADLRLTELASDQMDGIHAGLLMMAPQVSAADPDNAAMLVERYRQVGTLLDQAVQRFRQGLAAGRTPAELVIRRSLNQLDSYLASAVGSDPFVNLGAPEGWDGEPAWRAELETVVREVIRPGFQRYREALADDLLPASRPDEQCGLLWLGEDGREVYQSLVRRYTTLDDLTADELHTVGLEELERLRGEYSDVGRRLFGTGDQAEIFARLRTGRDLNYEDGDEIMADARRCLADATAAMGDWFGRLPREGCDIVPVPDFLAADAPAAYYFPPAADGSRPGTYFVNQHNATERHRYETASIAFHEAIPGHHLQLAIANELTHLPRFQRHSSSNTAFVEGWALYTERLADEMGLYRSDLDRVGMLAADSWRSCRLVVDTGMHAKGWSRQQAVDFMAENTPVGVAEIQVEIDRYVAIAGQALSYKTGQLELRRLRALAEQRDGAVFDLKAFHDRVLGSGSVSLPVLRELVG